MKKYNSAILPFYVSFVLFCFIFIALINSGYFFEKSVIFASFLCSALWLAVALLKMKGNRGKDVGKCFTKENFFLQLILFMLGIFLGFYYASKVWFSGYLNLFPIEKFLDNTLYLDTSYLSCVSESFLTNGYPSIYISLAGICDCHKEGTFTYSRFWKKRPCFYALFSFGIQFL